MSSRSAFLDQNIDNIPVIAPSGYHERSDTERSFMIHVNQIALQDVFDSVRVAGQRSDVQYSLTHVVYKAAINS